MLEKPTEKSLFAKEETMQKEENPSRGSWKVLIVDDERDIHNITKLTFEDFDFERKNIHFISAYSAKEAKELIQKNPDTALILLDVVMEEPDAGLKFVKYLREDIKNSMTRIILRTGHPGRAPENKIIIDYDINDYKEKTELTATKLYTAIVVALRSFRDLKNIEEAKHNLQEVIDATNRFIPNTFLKVLNKDSIVNIELGEHIEQEMSVLFLDIRSFTAMSESNSPLVAFNFINTCMSYLEPTIIQFEGFIDKYMGDSIMALFCGPADNAIIAAIQMLSSLRKYNAFRESKNEVPIKVGLGIDSGAIIMGTIGFHDRMDCTAISNVVNMAAKLEKYCKEFDVSLLVTERAILKLKNAQQFNYRLISVFHIQGTDKSLPIYEVFDADLEPNKKLKLQTKDKFHEALQLYLNGNYLQSNKLFKEIHEINKADTAAEFYINTTNYLIKETEL